MVALCQHHSGGWFFLRRILHGAKITPGELDPHVSILFCHIRLLSFTYCVRAHVRQPPPITELDGTVSGDFFTVLCVGQGFTEDQWMNVYSFSMLRHWLLTYHSVSNGNSTVDTGKAEPLLMSSFT